jgi:hypothetical protein
MLLHSLWQISREFARKRWGGGRHSLLRSNRPTKPTINNRQLFVLAYIGNSSQANQPAGRRTVWLTPTNHYSARTVANLSAWQHYNHQTICTYTATLLATNHYQSASCSLFKTAHMHHADTFHNNSWKLNNPWNLYFDYARQLTIHISYYFIIQIALYFWDH